MGVLVLLAHARLIQAKVLHFVMRPRHLQVDVRVRLLYMLWLNFDSIVSVIVEFRLHDIVHQKRPGLLNVTEQFTCTDTDTHNYAASAPSADGLATDTVMPPRQCHSSGTTQM